MALMGKKLTAAQALEGHFATEGLAALALKQAYFQRFSRRRPGPVSARTSP